MGLLGALTPRRILCFAGVFFAGRLLELNIVVAERGGAAVPATMPPPPLSATTMLNAIQPTLTWKSAIGRNRSSPKKPKTLSP
ncbi:hypothetical protein Pelo_17274 [Pelomyxa schiedti]|nr:hypothetical protein Pelo_17274 [Pelomyxa schiedti]